MDLGLKVSTLRNAAARRESVGVTLIGDAKLHGYFGEDEISMFLEQGNWRHRFDLRDVMSVSTARPGAMF